MSHYDAHTKCLNTMLNIASFLEQTVRRMSDSQDSLTRDFIVERMTDCASVLRKACDDSDDLYFKQEIDEVGKQSLRRLRQHADKKKRGTV